MSSSVPFLKKAPLRDSSPSDLHKPTASDEQFPARNYSNTATKISFENSISSSRPMNISLCVCAWFLSLVFCAPWCCLFFIEVTPGKGAAVLVISSCIPLLKVNLFLGFPLQCFHCRIQFHVIKVVHETPFRFSRPIMNKYSKCFRTWEWFVNIFCCKLLLPCHERKLFLHHM